MSTSILIPGSGKGAPALHAAVKGRSLWDDARRRLFRNKAAVASMIVLALLVVAAIVGPHLTAYRYDEINKDDVWLGPLQNGHFIGTDSLGRDLFPHCRGFERPHQHRGTAPIEACIHRLEPADMEQRHAVEIPVAKAIIHARGRVEDCPEGGPMRVHHTLRPASRA